MPIIAKKNSGNFTPHPEGQFAAVCVDVVDLGVIETHWQGQIKHKHKIEIFFFCGEWKDGEDGKKQPLFVRERFTLSLNDKGNLKKFLEAWRGRQFTKEEEEGFDIEKLIGAPAVVQVVHREDNGNTYANILSAMRILKGMDFPEKPKDYVRVCDRPKEGQENGQQPTDDEDDPLPF